MIRVVLCLLCAMGVGTAAFAAEPPNSPPVSPSTEQAISQPASPAGPLSTESFLGGVAAAGQFEIASSKLALDKSKSNRIKAFASHMLDEHTVIAARLRQAVSRAGLAMPAEKPDAGQQLVLDDLQAHDAASFDKAYIDAQRKVIGETVGLFRTYATVGDDAQVKKFAQELLLTLRSELDDVGKLR